MKCNSCLFNQVCKDKITTRLRNSIARYNFNQKQIGSEAETMAAPCINEGFENTAPGTYNGAVNAYAVQGWTLYGAYANSNAVNYNCISLGTPYNLGANEFEIVTTPLNFSGGN